MNNDINLNVDELKKRQQVMKVVNKVLLYGFLVFMAIIVLVPFYWMIISSLKSVDEVELTPPTYWPTKMMWENFQTAMVQSNFIQYFKNTVIVGVVSTCGTITTTVLAAFAFARLNFKGKDALFSLLLATMMIPGEMLVITNYITVSNIGWNNTYQVLIIPFICSVFYIFLLRQSFKQIPDELYYAAKVDGTSDAKYLFKVMIPLAKPTIITILILDLMGAWNSYVWPNLVQNQEEWRLISNWVRDSFTDVNAGRSQIHLQMAATVIVTAPLFLVFVFFRKHIMSGVGRSGIKG